MESNTTAKQKCLEAVIELQQTALAGLLKQGFTLHDVEYSSVTRCKSAILDYIEEIENQNQQAKTVIFAAKQSLDAFVTLTTTPQN